VGVSLKLLNGKSATVSDGIAIATAHLGQVIGFTLISATIGTFVKLLGGDSGNDSDNPIFGILTMIVGGLLEGAWSMVVFFAIPIYVVENLGPIAAIRRSLAIFKKTWSEGFSGQVRIWSVSFLIQCLLLFVIVALFAVTVTTNSAPLLILTITFGITSFVAISLISGAINCIFQASLYHFAITGNAGRFIDNDLARSAFSR
jgi:hypothetical protein